MRQTLALGLTIVSVSAAAALAGPTQRACLTSERTPGPRVCACAQAMADRILSPGDQSRAASIIAEPDLYLKFKYDGKRSSKAFIERYRYWGEVTSRTCR